MVWLIVAWSIGNLNLVADEWQVEPFGDLLLNLSEVPFRFGFPGVIQSFLGFVFQFKIKLDPEILTSTAFDALGFFQVGAVNLRVMLRFTRFHKAVVEPLIWRKVAGLMGQNLPVLRERDDFAPCGAKPPSAISRGHGITP